MTLQPCAKFIFLLVFLTALNIHVNAQQKIDSNFHLYVLVGQSNMAGRGEISHEFRDQSHPNVFMLNKDDQWVKAKHPLHFDKPPVVGVGPGLAFGISMAKTDSVVKIGLIPCAVGGSSIDDWRPGAYYTGTKTHPYDDALIRIKKSMKSGIIKGVLWHQGEADRCPEKAKEYLHHLTELIKRIRLEVGNPELPFIVGELGRYLPNCNNINRELSKVPLKIPYTAVVSSEGLVDKGDSTHFDSPSSTILGHRF
ncbi:MAG: sialate O-acetylesterase, partial [Cyclobacteriaceae bacterium]